MTPDQSFQYRAPALSLVHPAVQENRSNPHLIADNLTLCYGTRPAFQNVSVTARRGGITALVGPSGCGKTSFLNCLNRLTDLIPHCCVTGRLQINGEDILSPRMNLLELRRRVGMIFQQPSPFPLSIRKNLELPLSEHGCKDRHEMAHRIESALTDVGLWPEVQDRLNASALTLSGGQQQRLCLARALVLSPEILLLDEPCSALDPISSGVVEDHIQSLRGRLTIIMVSHNLAQARRLADHVGVFWLQDGIGCLIEHGPVDQIFHQPQNPITAAYIRGARG